MKTSVMPQRHQIMQVMPQRHQFAIKTGCQDTYVTKTAVYEDISYAIKTSNYANYATKTSICHKDGVPRYLCHKDCGIWLGNHTCHGTRVKTTYNSQLNKIETCSLFPSSFIKPFNIQAFHKVLKFSKIISFH